VDDWSATSRQVFVCRVSESSVAVYDKDGLLIDDPANFVCGGLQGFRDCDGDHFFLGEWTNDPEAGYYRVPPRELWAPPASEPNTVQMEGGGGQPAVEPEPAPGPQPAELQLQPESESTVEPEPAPGPQPAELQLQPESVPESVPESESEGLQLMQRLQPGIRIWASHPHGAEKSWSRASIFLRRTNDSRGDTIVLVFDDLLPPQHLIIPLSASFMHCCSPSMFVKDDDDGPIGERCVAVMMGRSSKDPEGYFYGQYYLGYQNRLLAPDSYSTVDAGATRPRYPVNLQSGTMVTLEDDATQQPYTFLRFIILQEPGQARFWALLGNPAALLPSPTLLNRYAIIGLKASSEPTFAAAPELSECRLPILSRLRGGVENFLADLTAAQLKRGDFIKPKPSTPTSPAPAPAGTLHPPLDANASPAICQLPRFGLRDRTRLAAGPADPVQPTPESASDVVLPSQFPYNLKNCGEKKFHKGLTNALPPPTHAELIQLCEAQIQTCTCPGCTSLPCLMQHTPSTHTHGNVPRCRR
jgi:hypothetical protein